jgi:hypothetical protein
MIYYIAWFGLEIPEYNIDKINNVKSFVESKGHEFTLIHTKIDIHPEQATILKDNLWLEMACNTLNGVFLDADIDLFEIPELIKGKPYFSIYNKKPHIGYFMVNNCCDWFIKLLDEKRARGIHDVYMFTNKLFRNKIDEVYQIPDTSYKHYFNMRR